MEDELERDLADGPDVATNDADDDDELPAAAAEPDAGLEPDEDVEAGGVTEKDAEGLDDEASAR